ncbi:MAG: hypothetical protein WBF53_09625 [Litorimonas sp.]
MKGPILIRVMAVCLAALFLLGQGVAQAEALEHAVDHDAECVACPVTILAEDPAPLPDPVEVEAPIVVLQLPVALTQTRTVRFVSAHPGRAPPPRAPPF